MKKLKDVRDIIFIAFVAVIGLILIDYFVYKSLYLYLYMALAVFLLVVGIILSIIIYDTKEVSLIDSLKNGKSFELEVNKIEYNTYFAKRYAHYMKILNGMD